MMLSILISGCHCLCLPLTLLGNILLLFGYPGPTGSMNFQFLHAFYFELKRESSYYRTEAMASYMQKKI